MDVPDGGFGGEMAVAAEGVADVLMPQQRPADRVAAEVRLGEIPLRRMRGRQQFAKGQVMRSGDDGFGARDRGGAKLAIEPRGQLSEKLLNGSVQLDEPPVVPARD